MLSLQGRQEITTWLDSGGIDQLVVISPHLDDAVFSLGGLISAVPEITEVITVLTEGAPDAAVDWAYAGGFADPIEEHAARRKEDQRAMEHIGCRFRHLGLRSDQLTEAAARHHVQALWGPDTQPSASMLVLLPAGAGGERPLLLANRWVRRILRRPFGSMTHPEHKNTRDYFHKALSAIPAQLGFYAELPYVWNESLSKLADRLSASCLNPLDHVQIKPNVEKKQAAAEFYTSQTKIVLGEKTSYRRRVLGSKEHLFLLPKHDARVAYSRL